MPEQALDGISLHFNFGIGVVKLYIIVIRPISSVHVKPFSEGANFPLRRTP